MDLKFTQKKTVTIIYYSKLITPLEGKHVIPNSPEPGENWSIHTYPSKGAKTCQLMLSPAKGQTCQLMFTAYPSKEQGGD